MLVKCPCRLHCSNIHSPHSHLWGCIRPCSWLPQTPFLQILLHNP